MADFSVLYDGWPLVFAPNSPAALHLQCLLLLHPPQAGASLALPGKWTGESPEYVLQHVRPTPNTDLGRLAWEQSSLPRIAKKTKACLIHLTSGMPALLAGRASLLSPAEEVDEPGESPGRMSLAGRLRSAFGRGGMTRLGAMLWPDDLPGPQAGERLSYLPPVVAPVFGQETQFTAELEGLALPDTFILAQAAGRPAELRRLLDAWSWAAGPLGDYYPLVVPGLGPAGQALLASLSEEYELENSVRPLPPLRLTSLAALYQRCSAYFHTSKLAAWGDPARLALASGRPLVGLETRLMDALAGPAAYLVSGDRDWRQSSRLLGAALVTVVVEESVSEELSQAARRRAAPWLKAGEQFSEKLAQVYQSLVA